LILVTPVGRPGLPSVSRIFAGLRPGPDSDIIRDVTRNRVRFRPRRVESIRHGPADPHSRQPSSQVELESTDSGCPSHSPGSSWQLEVQVQVVSEFTGRAGHSVTGKFRVFKFTSRLVRSRVRSESESLSWHGSRAESKSRNPQLEICRFRVRVRRSPLEFS
jgi:hypothetical protein